MNLELEILHEPLCIPKHWNFTHTHTHTDAMGQVELLIRTPMLFLV